MMERQAIDFYEADDLYRYINQADNKLFTLGANRTLLLSI